MRHKIFLLAQLVLVVTVILIFRTIETRKVAALIAGFLFLTVPAYFFVWDLRVAQEKERLKLLWRFTVLQFWIVFALPIFFARVWYWNMNFQDVVLLGVPAPLLHRFSNASFMIMVLGTVFKIAADFLEQRTSRSEKPK